uniref:Uncharacterized protein n=1 Tax=Arundo donax TaxID=35708 RepID=A0A0A9GEQ3_ARUDO
MFQTDRFGLIWLQESAKETFLLTSVTRCPRLTFFLLHHPWEFKCEIYIYYRFHIWNLCPNLGTKL